jgi:hypothetical protein
MFAGAIRVVRDSLNGGHRTTAEGLTFLLIGPPSFPGGAAALS